MWKACPCAPARTRRHIHSLFQGVQTIRGQSLCYFYTSLGYDAQFLPRRVLELKWVTKFIMDGIKILSIFVENLHFLDSLKYLPMNIKSMPKSFDLTSKKRYYHQFFNTPTIWIKWALIPNTSTMGQSLFQVMIEPNFRPDIRVQKTNL